MSSESERNAILNIRKKKKMKPKANKGTKLNRN